MANSIHYIITTSQKLLLKKTKWQRMKVATDHGFSKAKSMLSLSDSLVHFDPSKELVLKCDASPHGLRTLFTR